MHPIPPYVNFELFDLVCVGLNNKCVCGNTYECIMTIPKNVVCKTQRIAAICLFARRSALIFSLKAKIMIIICVHCTFTIQ